MLFKEIVAVFVSESYGMHELAGGKNAEALFFSRWCM
jgi:hypothetical protein